MTKKKKEVETTPADDAKVLKRIITKLLVSHKAVIEGDSVVYSDIMRSMMLLNQLIPAEWQFKPTVEGWSILKNMSKEVS